MSGSIIRRGKKSWRVKFDAGRNPDGTRATRYLTVKGTRDDAKKALTDALHSVQHGTFVDPSKLTVGEFLEKWLTDYAASSMSGKTFERVAEIVRRHLVPALGAIKLRDLKPLDIQGHYGKALASGRLDGKGALSANSVRAQHVQLKAALDRAIKWRLLAINPAAAVDPPKVHRGEIKVLDDVELAKLLREAQSSPNFTAYLLAATTGMRRGEVCGLRWCDVDFGSNTGAKLTVNQSLEETRKGLAFKAPKTKSSRRTISLPTFTVEALRKHRTKQAEDRLALGLGRDDTALVFSLPTGEPIQPLSLTVEFGRIVKLTKVRRITLHGLRHSHATSLLRAGVNPKVVSERLGHASVATTLSLYAAVLPDMQTEAATRVDAILRRTLGE